MAANGSKANLVAIPVAAGWSEAGPTSSRGTTPKTIVALSFGRLSFVCGAKIGGVRQGSQGF